MSTHIQSLKGISSSSSSNSNVGLANKLLLKQKSTEVAVNSSVKTDITSLDSTNSASGAKHLSKPNQTGSQSTQMTAPATPTFSFNVANESESFSNSNAIEPELINEASPLKSTNTDQKHSEFLRSLEDLNEKYRQNRNLNEYTIIHIESELPKKMRSLKKSEARSVVLQNDIKGDQKELNAKDFKKHESKYQQTINILEPKLKKLRKDYDNQKGKVQKLERELKNMSNVMSWDRFSVDMKAVLSLKSSKQIINERYEKLDVMNKALNTQLGDVIATSQHLQELQEDRDNFATKLAQKIERKKTSLQSVLNGVNDFKEEIRGLNKKWETAKMDGVKLKINYYNNAKEILKTNGIPVSEFENLKIKEDIPIWNLEIEIQQKVEAMKKKIDEVIEKFPEIEL